MHLTIDGLVQDCSNSIASNGVTAVLHLAIAMSSAKWAATLLTDHSIKSSQSPTWKDMSTASTLLSSSSPQRLSSTFCLACDREKSSYSWTYDTRQNIVSDFFLSTHFFTICGKNVSILTWEDHDMETLSTLLALCVGYPLGINGLLSQMLVMWRFDVCFVASLKKLLNSTVVDNLRHVKKVKPCCL